MDMEQSSGMMGHFSKENGKMGKVQFFRKIVKKIDIKHLEHTYGL